VHVLETDRLRHVTPDDAAFIVELVNEPAWTHFIGDRGIRPPDEARA
jgi:ribosomal-protein-alanine N-acetyltransferase